ncbi:MAG: type IV pilus secretin PilQ family protein [Pseudomonadota bacterium]|uniref:type IV pilus secretin PilQ n=1 Tax=Gallaecimonas pentaromativorans TaxID=584787 RepID=UPI00067F688D|nr:type IV pilus secretin PilQ family protein [Gallaecimonas pentaromativorans]MED5526836.1 type IV pilus secretin PilQ family protein [Pseudomonadota bacterium]
MNACKSPRTPAFSVWRRAKQIALGLLLAMPVAQALATSLVDVKENTLGRQGIELEFVMDGDFIEPRTRISYNPAELYIDFRGVDSKLAMSELAVAAGGLDKITTTHINDGVRAVLHLDKLMSYQTKRVENRYVVSLGQAIAGGSEEGDGKQINAIKAIDFRRGKDDEGKMLVFMQNTSAAVDVHQQGPRIVAEFLNTAIPDKLIYQLDVTDFGTPVQNIETFRDGDKTRIVIKPTGNFTFKYQQANNLFSLEVLPKKETAKEKEKASYDGKRISLNFQDIPVRTVLQIIADYNNFNLVTSDTVNGNITLRLDGVPWDQALDIVLKVKGLGKRVDGNILMVAPADELTAREAQELEAQNKVQTLVPLFSEFIQINYAKAKDLADLLKSSEASLLSERGTVTIDERTNTLLVQDTEDKLKEIKNLIKVLDVPVKQVLIESRIVTVKDSVVEDLGVRLGFTDANGSNGVSGTLEGANGAANGGSSSVDLADRLNVNLPAGAENAASIGFHIAKLADGKLLDLELSALEQENKGEIISNPRLTTANQKAAYIEQGTEIPYVQSTSSGATSVTFKKAVLSLQVTPQITPDNKIILDLVITEDTRGDTVQTATGSAVAIDTKEIGTQVLVDNGETIVLGGIFQQERSKVVYKVPLLGDIPGLGWLFRNTSDSNVKSELLIFVTPRIVTEDLD